MEKYLCIIIVFIILIIITKKDNAPELFVSNENIHNIWMYWENLPGKKKSPYFERP